MPQFNETRPLTQWGSFFIRAYEDAGAFPFHIHPHVEIWIVTGGEMGLTADGKDYILRGGDLAVIFPNTVHAVNADAGTKNAGVFATFLPSVTPELHDTFVSYRPSVPFLPAEKQHPDIAYTAGSLNAELKKDKPDKAVLMSMIHLITARALLSMPMKKNTDNPPEELFYRIMDYISKNFNRPLKLSEIAENLGVNRYYLSHFFAERFQMHYNGYLNKIRIEHARSMLQDTDRPITDICFDSGFEQQRTFNRVFRELCGTTPRDYRKRQGSPPSK